MKKLLAGAAALSALAIVGFSGTAHAFDCAWMGTYWNCGDRVIYPKSYPWGTAMVNGQYTRPPSPPDSDVMMPPAPGAQPPR
jgi:hypothetical protein